MPRQVKKEDNSWLMSYSDTVTLLMAFFVLLLSLSTIDQAKLEQFEEGISDVLLKKHAQKPFANVKEQIEKMIEVKSMQKDISVNTDPLGIKLEFSSNVLYTSGTAEVKPQMIHILKEVAETIKGFTTQDYRVKVEGHTDDDPINTLQFPSNWELSASRATNIVRHFIRFGVPKEKLVAMGLSDSRPLKPNKDEFGLPIEANQAANRRVVIYIHRH